MASMECAMQIYKPNKPKGAKRRESIIKGFVSALEKQGFSNTSMAGVAHEAGIAPSHVFYYFKSTADILREVFKDRCEAIVEGMEALKEQDFDSKINYLSDFFYTENKSVNHITTGVMYEAIGASVADPSLAVHKAEMDRCCIELLAGVFNNGQMDDEERTERAEILYSCIAGSKLNGYFSQDADLGHGRSLFIKAAYILASDQITKTSPAR
jgi:AcrR family transcriptional regulator